VSRLVRRQAQQLAIMKSLRSDEVLETYLNALATSTTRTRTIWGIRRWRLFSIAMKLSLFGVGASLESEDGYCKIRELLPGGPAARSGC